MAQGHEPERQRAAFPGARDCPRSMISCRSGKIFNIASIVGVSSSQEGKTTVERTTRRRQRRSSSRVHWRPSGGVLGIDVNAVCPGFFPTTMTAGYLDKAGEQMIERTPLRRPGGDENLKRGARFLRERRVAARDGPVSHDRRRSFGVATGDIQTQFSVARAVAGQAWALVQKIDTSRYVARIDYDRLAKRMVRKKWNETGVGFRILEKGKGSPGVEHVLPAEVPFEAEMEAARKAGNAWQPAHVMETFKENAKATGFGSRSCLNRSAVLD